MRPCDPLKRRWHRDFKDATNDPNDPYDKGAPDYQSGEKKNRKWEIIVQGVQTLIRNRKLNENEVFLWIDWQSIYQDDKVEKLKGVMSLLKYVTLCEYMLIVTDLESIMPGDYGKPNRIRGYGDRGWCRIELFIFGLLAEMVGKGEDIQLYVIGDKEQTRRGPIWGFEHVRGFEIDGRHHKGLPSEGELSNPNDREVVKGIEDKLIDASGFGIVEHLCQVAGAEAPGRRMVLFNWQILRPMHMETVIVAAYKYGVEKLWFMTYRGDDEAKEAGGLELAKALMAHQSGSLKKIELSRCGSHPKPSKFSPRHTASEHPSTQGITSQL